MNYFTRALLEAVLVGGLAGVVGVQVVLRRLAFFTMSLTHATFPGLVLAGVLGVNLYLGSGAFGVLLVLAVAWVGARREADTTSVVGVLLAGGFALGVVLMSAQAGFTKDLTAYLVGHIVTVQPSDLVVTGVTAVVVLAVLAALRKELLLGAFDRGTLVAQGYPAIALDIVVLLLIEATVVSSIAAVGTILVVALIVAPAATARLWTDRIGPMTALSAAFGIASGVAGLSVSQWFDVAAGAAIVLVACLLFGVSLLMARQFPRPRVA